MDVSVARCFILAALFSDGTGGSLPPHEGAAQEMPSAGQSVTGHSHAERLRRAGCPNCIAPWAHFTYDSKYCGYFVGGGAPFYRERAGKLHGERRYWYEGTWGVDYNPWYSRVRLQWYHGSRRQDGEGQYEPDGHNNPLIPLFLR